MHTATLKQEILDILTHAGYQGNKEAFIEKFFLYAMKKAFVDFATKLPLAVQSDLQNKITAAQDTKSITEILQPYMESRRFQRVFMRAFSVLEEEYIKSLLPTLSQEQRANLKKYFTQSV